MDSFNRLQETKTNKETPDILKVHKKAELNERNANVEFYSQKPKKSSWNPDKNQQHKANRIEIKNMTLKTN